MKKREMARKATVMLLTTTMLILIGCKATSKEKIEKPVEQEFVEMAEGNNNEIKGQSEIYYDNNVIKSTGEDFQGIVDTMSYQILPVENSYIFKIDREPFMLKAEFMFERKGSSLSFIVDLLNGEIMEKKMDSTDERIINLTDEEILDLANTIKRMNVVITDWP